MYSPGTECLIQTLYVGLLVTDRLPETGFSGTRNQPNISFLMQIKQGFASFFANFFWHI